MKYFFLKQFQQYKELGELTFKHLSDEEVFWQNNPESNSIATTVKNLLENIISQWTNTDERQDQEAQDDNNKWEYTIQSKAEMLELWDQSWLVLFNVLQKYSTQDFNKNVLNRGSNTSGFVFLSKELADYAYIIGQIVSLSKTAQRIDDKICFAPETDSELKYAELEEKKVISEIQPNASPVCFAKSEEVREDYK